MEIEFAPVIEDIKKALDNEIEDNIIIADLNKLLEFRVPLNEAKRSLIKKYSGSEKCAIRKLKDIRIGEHNIEIMGKIVEITKKTIVIKNIEKDLFYGIICDETSSRSFTAWSDFNIYPGDVISVTQAYVRNWHERPEINFGGRSKVIKLNTQIQVPEYSDLKKLNDLKDGDINVHTQFKILTIGKTQINTKDGSKNILAGIVADEDTKFPVTSWVLSPELVEGNTIEVKNTYVRSFRGVPTLNLNESSIVTKIEKKIEYKEKDGIKIADLINKDGAYDIAIEGNILSIRPGSGLISRCPECSRVILKGICRMHGEVEEQNDMRIKAIIDDGTGAMLLVLDSRLTQKISGVSIEEAKIITKNSISQKAVEDNIRRKLLGRRLAARGNMSKGEFGIMLVASDVWEPPETIQEQASKLIRRIAI